MEQDRTLTIRDRQGSLEATFVPGAGMICTSLRHEGEELLGQRGGLEPWVQKGSTFGIPLMHPWANRLRGWEYEAGGKLVQLDRDDPLIHQDTALGIPMHGLLSASPHWQLTDADLDLVTAELDFAAIPEYMRYFPFPHRLTLTTSVKQSTLEVALTLTPTGEEAVPVSFGFHPYISLPGSDKSSWMVQMPLVDQIAPSYGASTEAGPLGDRLFNDDFSILTGAPPVFTVADDRRRVAVEFVHGYSAAVVWTEADSDFICFEPLTSPVDALRTGEGLRWAQPGEEYTAVFMVAVDAV